MSYKVPLYLHTEAFGDTARGAVFRAYHGDHPFRSQTFKGAGQRGPRALRRVAHAPAFFHQYVGDAEMAASLDSFDERADKAYNFAARFFDRGEIAEAVVFVAPDTFPYPPANLF